MKTDNLLLGLGAAALGLIMTFGMPVSTRRVNQALISLILGVAFGVAALALFEMPMALLVAAAAILGGLIFRAIVRAIRSAVWDITKYTRRDWWYRRAGQSLFGSRRRSRGR